MGPVVRRATLNPFPAGAGVLDVGVPGFPGVAVAPGAVLPGAADVEVVPGVAPVVADAAGEPGVVDGDAVPGTVVVVVVVAVFLVPHPVSESPYPMVNKRIAGVTILRCI